MTPLERITQRIERAGNINDPRTPRPLLKLEEFFEGNNVVGSIGCNLVPTPTPAEFLAQLKRVASRPEVHDVRVQITMFDAPEWPFSDTVWVFTSAAADEVILWFDEALRPDACHVGWPNDPTVESFVLPPGIQPIACWWN